MNFREYLFMVHRCFPRDDFKLDIYWLIACPCGIAKSYICIIIISLIVNVFHFLCLHPLHPYPHTTHAIPLSSFGVDQSCTKVLISLAFPVICLTRHRKLNFYLPNLSTEQYVRHVKHPECIFMK